MGLLLADREHTLGQDEIHARGRAAIHARDRAAPRWDLERLLRDAAADRHLRRTLLADTPHYVIGEVEKRADLYAEGVRATEPAA